jgi:hypothetical protein
MKTQIDWALGANVRVRGATHNGASGRSRPRGLVPPDVRGAGDRRLASTAPTNRRIQDLPMQATRVILNARIRRFRCLNRRCKNVTFTE